MLLRNNNRTSLFQKSGSFERATIDIYGETPTNKGVIRIYWSYSEIRFE